MNNNYITVTEVNKYIKEIVNEDLLLKKVYLKGEISNFKAHSRGHYYFTLKDENSRIAAVMFSFNNRNLKFVPYDGMKVLVSGKIDVYEASGSYQIYVEEMAPDGIGELYVAFEQLKEKLSKEELFDKDKKKKVRRVPNVVGIVTSPTGAAIRDILTTIKRRYPVCKTILFPALVQGDNAALDIAKKIKLANEVKDIYGIDTLIVGRGGGSLEDLWPFNEEIVARAIYNSELPIVSSVGHETDFTIADFVADLRAPTPSAAAELVVADIDELQNSILVYQNRLKMSLKRKTELMRLKLENCMKSRIFKDPYIRTNNAYLELDSVMKKFENNISKKIEKIKMDFSNKVTKLDTLSPLKTLSRGYCVTEFDNKVISNSRDLKSGMEIDLKFYDGDAKAKVL